VCGVWQDHDVAQSVGEELGRRAVLQRKVSAQPVERHCVSAAIRHLVVVFGDQLNRDSTAFDGFDPQRDVVWMAEVAEESTKVWVSKPRITVFLSAMRHFAQELRAEGLTVDYRELDDPANGGTFAAELTAAIDRLTPESVVVVEPGEWQVRQSLRESAASTGVRLDERVDTHFLCSIDEFGQYAEGRRSLVMETFYRGQRRKHGILMDGDAPAGGAWNFDSENRRSFGASGPGLVPEPARFEPDSITRAVAQLVEERFGGHPGSLEQFAWPVTRRDALAALDLFVAERLSDFGRWQDAMWDHEPWLYHSHISSALNLKLLSPREAVAVVEAAWRAGAVPIEAAEGFVRQVIGWREYVRGIYWLKMPEYGESNALAAGEDLPGWFWTGETDLACLRDAIGQTLEYGYAHHIQRLMVTGLYAQLLGVDPKQVHEWYLAVYIDAVEWAELPNVIGMSQFADGGFMASKPYVATGKYIDRMSNHCRSCRYSPGVRVGEDACPFTTLYWDFLERHEDRFAGHPRMALQVKNLARISDGERGQIAERAAAIRRGEVG
jgi:deoxyribodipyrimidine photolyase-related protein